MSKSLLDIAVELGTVSTTRKVKIDGQHVFLLMGPVFFNKTGNIYNAFTMTSDGKDTLRVNLSHERKAILDTFERQGISVNTLCAHGEFSVRQQRNGVTFLEETTAMELRYRFEITYQSAKRDTVYGANLIDPSKVTETQTFYSELLYHVNGKVSLALRGPNKTIPLLNGTHTTDPMEWFEEQKQVFFTGYKADSDRFLIPPAYMPDGKDKLDIRFQKCVAIYRALSTFMDVRQSKKDIREMFPVPTPEFRDIWEQFEIEPRTVAAPIPPPLAPPIMRKLIAPPPPVVTT